MGAETSVACSVSDARVIIGARAQDVLIIDRMLGTQGEDGLDLLDDLPAAPWRPAVLVLSQVASAEARVHGLDAGADDYLAKPFEPMELRARVTALLRRRAPPADDGVLRYKALSLDTMGRAVLWEGRSHAINEQMFQLLATLMRVDGEAVSREMIWRAAWPLQTVLGVQETVLQVAIHRLRQRLLEVTGQRWVQGVRGIGYRLGVDAGR